MPAITRCCARRLSVHFKYSTGTLHYTTAHYCCTSKYFGWVLAWVFDTLMEQKIPKVEPDKLISMTALIVQQSYWCSVVTQRILATEGKKRLSCKYDITTKKRKSREEMNEMYEIPLLSSLVHSGLPLCQNAPRPSEHPPVRGEKMSKRLGGIKGY